ncbi:MAG: hypothetical protein OXU96_01165 [Gammaproteobacteria bacterium]|nr:hypothetical protein [Gammaproteobacteria bacterium]
MAAPVLAFVLLFAPQTADAQTTPPAHTFTLTGPATITETDADADTTYTVTRTGPAIDSIWQLTLTYSITLGTATAADFSGGTAPRGQLTFLTTETSKTFNIGIAGDDLTESGETFTILVFINPANGLDQTAVSINNGVALPADYTVTIMDDDPAASVTVSQTGLTVGEGRTDSAAYTLVLNAEATDTVTISLTSSDTGAATATPANLTFSTGNWNMAQTVTVTGVQDLDAMNEAVTVSHSVSQAGGGAQDGYDNVQVENVLVTVTDDEVAQSSLIISHSMRVVAEGASESYTINLGALPTASVTVTPASDNAALLSVNPAALTFTTSNWQQPQSVTVTAAQDDDAANNSFMVSHTLVSADTDYHNQAAGRVAVTVTDDDRGNITITFSESSLTVTEGSNDTYTAVLDVPPTGNVTVAPSAANADLTISPALLTFTSGNWNAPQTLTLEVAQDDDGVDEEGNIVVHTASGAEYEGVRAEVRVDITDDDTPAVNFSRTALTVVEGAVETYTATLSTAPSALLVVSVRSSASAVARVTNEVVFTPTDWSTPKALSVTGVEDANSVNDTAVLTHYLAGAMEYSGTSTVAAQVAAADADAQASDVTVTVTDNDTARVILSPTSLTANEGGSAVSYTVRLNALPGGDVIVTPATGGSTAVTVSPAALTFTTSTWATAQLVDVTAVDDSNSVGETVTVTHTLSGDAQYAGLTPEVVVTVTDDDTPGVRVSRSAVSVMEGATDTLSYTVRLNTPPSANVTISTTSSDTGAATVTPAVLTFTATSWNTDQTVTVAGAEDDDVGDEALSVTHSVSSTDTGYNGASVPDVAVTVTDDDMRGVRISVTGVTAEDDGGTATYTIRLESQPVGGSVVVTPSVANGSLAEVSAALTFNNLNWFITQDVTVTGRDDDDLADDTTEITHRVAGADYSGVTAAAVTVTVTDTDTLRAVASPTALTVDEGTNSGAYTVQLSHQPSGLVIVAPSSANTIAVQVSDELVFSSGNWNRAQTVSVAGIHDFDSANETVEVTHTVSGADSSGSTADTVTVTVTDDDSAGVTVSPTTLTIVEGETAVFTMRLNTQPSDDVAIDVDSSTHDEVTLIVAGNPDDLATLDFTSLNWNTPQTVSVSVVNDDSLGTGGSYSNAVTSAIDLALTDAPEYDAIQNNPPIDAVTVVAVDNDTAGVDISETTLTVNEGGEGIYTVRLTNQPAADVMITPATSQASVATVSPAVLTFSDSTWSTVQTVTVTGVDDGNTGDDTAAISHTVTGSAEFAGAQAPSVEVTVTDQRGVTVSVSELNVDEGGSDVYTMVLSAAPSGNVIITPSSSGAAATVAPVLTFSSTNWNTAQSVTVTAPMDDSNNANERVDITHAVTGYGSISSAPALSVTIRDNDAGVRISPQTLVINEALAGAAAATATYSVVLQSAPNANVTVTPSGSDSAVVTMLDPAALTFTSTNWNTAQTVTVTAGDDDVLTDPEATITHTLTTTATGYTSLTPGSVEVRVANTDVPGVIVTGFPSSVNEGNNDDTYTVALSNEPSGPVTVTPSADNSDVTFSPATLTFSTSNWNTAQTMTVNAGQDDDADNDTASVSHTASGADYQGVQSVPASLNIVDDEPGARGLMFSPSALTLDEGSFGSYTIRLGTQPIADVSVIPNFASPDVGQEGFMRQESLGPNEPVIFSPANWNMPQSVSVWADFDDNADDERVEVQHRIQSSDPNYVRTDLPGETSEEDLNRPIYQIPTFTLEARDSTRARVDISPVALSVDEGSNGIYTVVLSHQPTLAGSCCPTLEVTVTPAAPTLSSGRGTLTHNPAALTFTSGNWNAPQSVTVTSGQDDDGDDAMFAVSHTVSATAAVANYDSSVTADDVTVTVRDDERARGITATPDVVSVNEGETGTYTLVLDTLPAGDVMVTPSSDTPAVTFSDQMPDQPPVLTFTTTNWNIAQTVTVTGATDLNGADETATLTHALVSTADSNYNLNDMGRVVVTVVDSGSGLVVSPASETVTEGTDTGTYTVQLSTQPSGDVMVGLASDNPDVRLSPTALTFTTTNWGTAQTVMIDAAMDDDAADGMATVTHTASGADYDGATAEVEITVTDPDDPSIEVVRLNTLRDSDGQPGVREGTDGTYTVRLGTRPVGGLVSLGSSITNSDIFSLNPSALYFSADNWNTVQTVTVTAAEDDDADAESFSVTHTASGADYDGITGQLGETPVADNDRRGVTVRPTELVNLREGSDRTYTVRLNTQPSGGDVMVTPGVAGGASITVSGALTFTASNWNVGQGVVVTAEQDPNSVSETLTISHTVSGADYGSVTAQDVDVTVTDDDAPNVIVSAPSPATVSEGGSTNTATYTVRLGTLPSGNVMITPSSGSPAATVSAALTFTPGSWNIAQTVSVTSQHDDNGFDETVTVSHTVAGGGYAGVPVDDVTVMVMDDDERSVMVMRITNSVPEGGLAPVYSMVLSTPPVGGDVRVTPRISNTSDSVNERNVFWTPGQVVFTAGNWNVAQTVFINAEEDDNGADGTVTLSHTVSGADYDGATAEDIEATLVDNDTPGVSVSPTNLAVLKGRTGTYTVRLDTEPFPPGETVTVERSIAWSGMMGTVGVTPVRLSFTADNWNVEQIVSVHPSTDADSAADPAIISHQVSGADYGSVTAPAVTVTIITSTLGDINEVILSEVARAMGDQQVSAISNRVLQAGQDGGGAAAFSLGGQSTLSGLAAANAKTLAADDFDLKRMLGDSSFVTPLNASGGALSGSLAFWGGGDYRDLSGKSQDIEWEGNLFSVHLGLDARLRSDLLVGLMVSDSEGDLDYEAADNQQGEYDIDLTSVNPYIGWSLMDGRLDMWATTGYGEGDLEITPDDAQSSTTADVTMKMMALGGAGELSRSERAVVRLKGEAFYTRTHVDDTTSDPRAAMVGNADIDAHRARMTVEMESRYGLAGGAQLKQSVEAGFRVDGGDGRTGSGLEVGGGLHYHDALRGLTLESRARALLAHSGDYDEWGISGSVRVDPGADGQGLSVALSPSYGKTGSAMQDIWNKGLLGEKAKKADQDDLQAHLTARLGYGLSAAPLNGRWGAWGDGMLTPYSAMTLGGGKQQYRLGLQWGAGKLFDLDLFATRQEQRGKEDDHAVLLKGEVRF